MKFKRGLFNLPYIVFNNELEAEEFNEMLISMGIEPLRFACFGGLFNALELPV